jgi:hypothetical protein
MEASVVVPGPLDVAGTLSRLHLWGEDPASRCPGRGDVCPAVDEPVIRHRKAAGA